MRVTGAAADAVVLDHLTWDGEPDEEYGPVDGDGELWWRSWMDGVGRLSPGDRIAYLRLTQNRGRGMATIGSRDWRDVRVDAVLTPHLADTFGLATRVQGLGRHYAVEVVREGRACLVRHFDGEATRLAAVEAAVCFDRECELTLTARGRPDGGVHLSAVVDGVVLEADDGPYGLGADLDSGAAGVVLEGGTLSVDRVRVRPAGQD